MNPLLKRALGRLSPEGEAEAVVHSKTAAPEIPGADASIEAMEIADARVRLIRTLQQHIAQGSGGRLRPLDVREDAQLFDRGYLDSFSYVEFLAFIEETYSVRIDDSELAGSLNTIGAMATHILREQARVAGVREAR